MLSLPEMGEVAMACRATRDPPPSPSRSNVAELISSVRRPTEEEWAVRRSREEKRCASQGRRSERCAGRGRRRRGAPASSGWRERCVGGRVDGRGAGGRWRV
ncbi:hypothetical protein E2562_005902 [Oryza meyeriana var. granulata]|uniref:Uncharacterized protein n=1 Tax=Oryza meyeriana var. granulata TaxID=110450 RepID=A0A6G1DUJ8_9ORYZ|nr:hypothetical protein E2562_005902 [Oryza meyeriana var. granulata]